MERAAAHVTGWPVEILGFGDRDLPDAAHDVSAWGMSGNGVKNYSKRARWSRNR